MTDPIPLAGKTINNRRLIGNFVVLVLLVVTGWQIYLAFPPNKITIIEGKKFVGSRFEISMPKGWVIGDSERLYVEALFVEPARKDGQPFLVNVNVVSEATDDNIERYVNRNVALLKNKLKSYKLFGSKVMTLAGIKAVLIEGTFEQNGYTLQNKQMLLESNNRAYIVTGTALQGDWEAYNPVITQVLQSFKLK